MEVLQAIGELVEMRALYRERQPQRVLEIGVWDGGTLQEWLATRPRLVVAVDPEHRNYEAYDEWQRPPTVLVLGWGRSQEPAMVSLMRENGPYDWVFIDGDHDPEMVRQDVENTLPLIREGGLMLLHDIAPGTANTEATGPRRVFDQLRQGRESWEYVSDGNIVFPGRGPHEWAHGIGVVQL